MNLGLIEYITLKIKNMCKKKVKLDTPPDNHPHDETKKKNI